ncbi:OLC1v1007777C1 [Oldenlandia corymbosa var. corymbosa]|uniref:OLC1v1007777C1 n=1 Tax=Oldenlandia corymbosa var. corymbosa TaxID=529605 RepID=A0AAV1DMT7_OLDCO|nr:OLC1v1007777C1 [Oldenlandia corymbosa var. corymbosa]
MSRVKLIHFQLIINHLNLCLNCNFNDDYFIVLQILNRQVVKSETATIKIPDLDFEIPPEAQRGSLSTVEGILTRAADELGALQEERKKVDPQTADAIDQFLIKLRSCASGDSSFTFVLDDPSGNSFIENPFAPSPDPSLSIKFYERTPEQQASLGYLADPAQGGEAADVAPLDTNNGPEQGSSEPHGSVGARAGRRAIAQVNSAEVAETLFKYSAPEEVMTFPTTCGACGAKCECRMFVTNIPYFREVIVMASTCDSCGYRNSELKAGGSISPKGKKIIIRVENLRDLSRDVIKSDTAGVTIPELELELASGTLGGFVTTIEGLITKISESLERVHGFGDSLDDSQRNKWLELRTRLKQLLSLEKPWTLIIDDALANSFVAPATDDIKDDHQLSYVEYERSWEQNEEFGLNDLDTSSADVAYYKVNEGASYTFVKALETTGLKVHMNGIRIHSNHREIKRREGLIVKCRKCLKSSAEKNILKDNSDHFVGPVDVDLPEEAPIMTPKSSGPRTRSKAKKLQESVNGLLRQTEVPIPKEYDARLINFLTIQV